MHNVVISSNKVQKIFTIIFTGLHAFTYTSYPHHLHLTASRQVTPKASDQLST